MKYSKLRKQIVPEKSIQVTEGGPINCQPEAKMIWHVLGTAIEKSVQRGGLPIEIEKCEKRGGRMKVIVEPSNRCLEERNVAPPK